MVPLSSRSASTPRTRRKQTLFCPNCGHESPVDGDWCRRAETAGITYYCPVCGATVTRRENEPPDTASAPERRRTRGPAARASSLVRTVSRDDEGGRSAWPCRDAPDESISR